MLALQTNAHLATFICTIYNCLTELLINVINYFRRAYNPIRIKLICSVTYKWPKTTPTAHKISDFLPRNKKACCMWGSFLIDNDKEKNNNGHIRSCVRKNYTQLLNKHSNLVHKKQLQQMLLTAAANKKGNKFIFAFVVLIFAWVFVAGAFHEKSPSSVTITWKTLAAAVSDLSFSFCRACWML